MTQAHLVYRHRELVYTSFPTLPRAFEALCRLSDHGRLAEFDGFRGGRCWISFHREPVASWPVPPMPARAWPRLHAAVARMRGQMDSQLSGSA